MLRVLLAGVLLLLFSAITMNISFEGKLIQRLGNSSYEFYLGHLAVISIIARIFPQISSGAFITIVAFVTLIIAVLISKSSNIIIIFFKLYGTRQ